MIKKYILKPWILLAFGLFGISATVYNNDKLFEIAKNMELFANVFREVNTNYVDEVDPGTLMKIGIDAMLNSLDPYTNYITESQVQSYRISDDDRYQGIGSGFLEPFIPLFPFFIRMRIHIPKLFPAFFPSSIRGDNSYCIILDRMILACCRVKGLEKTEGSIFGLLTGMCHQFEILR